MIAVTMEDVEKVDAEVEEARQALAAAEREYTSRRSSPDAYVKHQDALRQLDHAEARARLLRGDWQEQEAVRDLRAAEGEAAAREMAGDVEGLVASRTAAVSAVVEARAAMRRALEALAEHDRLVRAAGEKLAARGLRSRDGEPTGAELDGSARIGGKAWPFIDGPGLLGHCLAEEVTTVSPRHLLARPSLGISGEACKVLAEVRGSKTGRNGR